MKLKKFIKKYIDHNSLVRLLYENEGGHEIVCDDWDDVSMEHEILKNKGIYKKYIKHKVIGITSILVSGKYSESINIVIERMPLKKIRKDKLVKIIEGKEKSNSRNVTTHIPLVQPTPQPETTKSVKKD